MHRFHFYALLLHLQTQTNDKKEIHKSAQLENGIDTCGCNFIVYQHIKSATFDIFRALCRYATNEVGKNVRVEYRHALCVVSVLSYLNFGKPNTEIA